MQKFLQIDGNIILQFYLYIFLSILLVCTFSWWLSVVTQIQQAADKAGVEPAQFCDQVAQKFQVSLRDLPLFSCLTSGVVWRGTKTNLKKCLQAFFYDVSGNFIH